MGDILNYLNFYYGIDKKLIDKVVFGKINCCVLLKNGNIGTCSTLENSYIFDLKKFDFPDFENFSHRIFINAYFNAILNETNDFLETGDISELVDFRTFENIVMVGYFRSLTKRLSEKNIFPNIFDLVHKNVSLPMEQQYEYLNKCDAAIVTATTIFNKTFENIYKNCKGDIFILGPSSIMHTSILEEFPKIKGIFGTIFNKNNRKIIFQIEKNKSPRDIFNYGAKAALLNNFNSAYKKNSNQKLNEIVLPNL